MGPPIWARPLWAHPGPGPAASQRRQPSRIIQAPCPTHTGTKYPVRNPRSDIGSVQIGPLKGIEVRVSYGFFYILFNICFCFLTFFVDFKSNMASNRSGNSLKTFLEVVRFFVTKYGPIPTHGDPIYVIC